jgi:lipoprotein-anchoring transpeptidase ErfK/SrfK
LRTSIGFAFIALASAGLTGEAAAQYYPAPYPYGVYAPPPPPPPYRYGRRYYRAAPLPPPGDDGSPIDQQGVQGPYGHAPYVERDSGYQSQALPGPAYPDPYGPAGGPYSSPGYGASPRVPTFGGEPVPRPPADIGFGAPETTGSIPGAAAGSPNSPTVLAALPPEDQPEQGPAKELDPRLRRQIVDYVTREPTGTIIIDTANTYLYLVLGHGKAMRYGIGVGREGFTWAGTERVSRMSEWPDWHPPKEMIERQPYLPRFMAGGEGNPLGARALYLGSTLYRIHGTNQPSTIGTFVSSGCIRLINEDIMDLYSRITVGTRVVVLPGSAPATAAARTPAAR